MGKENKSKMHTQQELPQSYQARFQNINRILIIYPMETARLRIARYALQHLFSSREDYEFMLLLPPDNELTTTEKTYENAVIDHNANKEQRIEIQDRIAAFQPDLLLQLEPNPSRRLSKVIQGMSAKLKMGFGKEKNGLNLIHSQKENSFYEKNILNLLSLLKS